MLSSIACSPFFLNLKKQFMKLIYQKTKRISPYPCVVVYHKITTYFLGIPIKSQLIKLK